MLKRHYASKSDDIDPKWRDRCVRLWIEDDAPVPDKERTSTAFFRISTLPSHSKPFHMIDNGDEVVHFYRGGWVMAGACDGGWVGVLLDPRTPPPAVEMRRVIRAAIRDDSGTIWSVPAPARHHDVIAYMRQSHYRGPVSGPERQGFVLSDGSFCTRAEALVVALASGQIRDGKTISADLTTEDLW